MKEYLENTDHTPMILIPYRITRKFIREHPDWVFVYGNDWFHKSALGQAWHCSGEPNTHGVMTIFKICSGGRTYLNDNTLDFQHKLRATLISIPHHGKVVIPFPKIGEGFSEMNKKAPLLFAYMKAYLNVIAYPDIEIDYQGKVYPVYPPAQ